MRLARRSLLLAFLARARRRWSPCQLPEIQRYLKIRAM